MTTRARWCRTSQTHFTAEIGRVGSLIVWEENATGEWSAVVLGSAYTGFASATHAKAAAVRLSRHKLEEGLWSLAELETAAPGDEHGAGATMRQTN